MENLKSNPTCLVTGRKDNLRMHVFRNDHNDMVGWVFLHESVSFGEIGAELKWNFKVSAEDGSGNRMQLQTPTP